MKDLRIFEDYETKKSTELSDYSKDLPTFQGFLLEDNDNKNWKCQYLAQTEESTALEKKSKSCQYLVQAERSALEKKSIQLPKLKKAERLQSTRQHPQLA